jgi:hypothetical protein
MDFSKNKNAYLNTMLYVDPKKYLFLYTNARMFVHTWHPGAGEITI